MANSLYLGVVTYQATLLLDNAQIKTLGAGAEFVLANGISGKVLYPIGGFASYNFSAAAYTNSADLAGKLLWDVSDFDALGGNLMTQSEFESTTPELVSVGPLFDDTALSDIAGNALIFKGVRTGGSGALTAGNAANTLAVTVNYWVIPTS